MKRYGIIRTSGGAIRQAEHYIRQIRSPIEAVAQRPVIGQPCPEIRAGYHKYSSGSHFLFYRLTEGGVEVVRILHKRMDFECRL